MLGKLMRVRIGTLFFYFCSLIVMAAVTGASQASNSYGVDAGPARANIGPGRIILENDLFAARWSFIHGKVTGADLIEHPFRKTYFAVE